VIVLIHIGLHRTASTSLQKWLRANSARLAAEGVMTMARGVAGGPELSFLIKDVAEQFGRQDAIESIAEYFQGLSRQWRAVVLSDENFLGAMPSPDDGVFGRLDYLCDVLRRLGKDHVIVPVIVLRHHADWLRSIHGFMNAQSLRPIGLAHFARAFPPESLQFRGMIEQIMDAAGGEPPMVHAYEDIGNDEGRGLLLRVMERVGVALTQDDALPRSNASVSPGLERLSGLLAEYGLAPSRVACPELAETLDMPERLMPCQVKQAALSKLIRRSAVPVPAGKPLRERLRAADRAYQSAGPSKAYLSEMDADGIVRSFLSQLLFSQADTDALAEIREAALPDRIWVARHYLPGWLE
jgi:hypothetical protein